MRLQVGWTSIDTGEVGLQITAHKDLPQYDNITSSQFIQTLIDPLSSRQETLS